MMRSSVTGHTRQSSNSSSTVLPNSSMYSEATVRHRHLGSHHQGGSHWSFPNGMYCCDSDEDSGIGHSNGGQGDRVGSTSSAEADVPFEFNGATKKVNVQRWSQPRMGTFGLQTSLQPVSQLRFAVQPEREERTKPTLSLNQNCSRPAIYSRSHSVKGLTRAPPPPFHYSESSGDASFSPFYSQLDKSALSAMSSRKQVYIHGTHLNKVSKASRTCSQRVDDECVCGLVTTTKQCLPLLPRQKSEVNGSLLYKQNLPVQDELIYWRQSRPPGTVEVPSSKSLWNFPCQSSRYANVYENTHRGCASEGMWNVRAQPVSARTKSRIVNNHFASAPVNVPLWRDFLPEILKDSCNPGTLQRARSASIASLITVDSNLVCVHARPAAVISASDAGDSLSESFFAQPDTLPLLRVSPDFRNRLQYRSFPGCYESVAPDTAQRFSLSQSAYTSSPISKDVPHPSQEARTEKCGEVEYAQVKKPKKKSKTLTNGNVAEELEPPLPPRNYRRNMGQNGRTASRSSLAERVQDFTRSAKQALRKAFSLDGLNRRSSSERSSVREWPVQDSEWGERRRTAASPVKPITPAAVKARDANRDRRNGALQTARVR